MLVGNLALVLLLFLMENLVNLHSIPNFKLWTLLWLEGCLAVDTVSSLETFTEERDIRLPFTAREKLCPLEPILWEKLHSSCTPSVCSVDQHLSRFSSTSKVLELLKTYMWLKTGNLSLFQI